MRASGVNIRAGVTTGVAVLAAAMWASLTQPAKASGTRAESLSCVPGGPGQARMLLDRVPGVASAQMAPTRDGDVVIAFWSYRGSREFPASRFTVLALNSSGCVRWRASLPGPWPIARPLQADAGSIVVAAGSVDRGGIGPLRIYTLSAATGRVRHSDVFPSLALVTGIAPTLVGDGRGDVAAVLATNEPAATRGRVRPVTLKLTRRARATRWTREVIARSNLRPPAAAARSDGTMVAGYPRRGRFWVRTGTVAGRLGTPMDAGPVDGNLQSAEVALGPNGTVAAVWESSTNFGPWHLRAAVRPATSTRFARFAQLGFAPRRSGGALPALHVSADGRATVGFFEAATARQGELVKAGVYYTRGVMCASATPAGHFDAADQVVVGGPSSYELAAMLFGPAGSSASVTLTRDGNALATAGTGCHTPRSLVLDPSDVGWPEQAVIDSRGRTWQIGQTRRGPGARRPLLLTITAPIR